VEEAAEARAGELHADKALALLGAADVDDAALGGEIGLLAERSVMRKRDGDLQVGADGNVKACDKGRSAPA
jgi:hypothetical protein